LIPKESRIVNNNNNNNDLMTLQVKFEAK